MLVGVVVTGLGIYFLKNEKIYIFSGFFVFLIVLLVYFYAKSKIDFSAGESPISNVTGLIGEYLIYLNIGDVSKESSSADIAGLMGTFGDFIGGTLNPILTFLTFICLLITISLQRKELKKSEEISLKNERESRFFKLLDIYSGAVNDLRLSPADVVLDIQSILDSSPKDTLSIELMKLLGSADSKYKEYVDKPSDLIGTNVIEFMLYHTRISIEYQNNDKYECILEKQKEKFFHLYEITKSSFYRYVSATCLVLSFIQKEKKLCTESEAVFYKSVFSSKISEAEYSIIILHCMHGSDDAADFIKLIRDTGILAEFYFKTVESNICLFGKQLLIDIDVARSLGGLIHPTLRRH